MFTKKFVKKHYPNVIAKRINKNAYTFNWLICDKDNSVLWIAMGATRYKAWLNAKKLIKENLVKE
jgi:hypothetical protein